MTTYKSSWGWKLLKKTTKAVLKALPILPFILVIDFGLLWLAKQYGLVIDTTVKGTITNGVISLLEIIVILIYADLLNLFGVSKKRK